MSFFLCRKTKMYATISLVAFLFGCAPPLKVTIHKHCAVVDFQYLGEYFTIVETIEIRAAGDNQLLWKAEAKPSTSPQMHQLTVCLGENSRVPDMVGDLESFDFRVPGHGDGFKILSDTEYDVVVTSPDYGRRARTRFTIPTGGA